MSIVVALFMALLFLPMHACNARLTFGFVSYDKNVEKAKVDERDMKIFPAVEDTTEIIQGGETMESVRAANLEVLKEKAARYLEESRSEEGAKEHTANKEDEAVEDVVVMDYVQAHRKSPIHNHH